MKSISLVCNAAFICLFSPVLLEASAQSTRDKPSITSVKLGDPVAMPTSQGDTWILAWTSDNSIYSPVNDGRGFGKVEGNINFNRIFGDQPEKLTGEGVIPPLSKTYGKPNLQGPDHATWKSSGCIALDGALYYVVARHIYGEGSGDPYKRQPARNASIIKSTDGGKTWTRSAQENYDHPMFPGTTFPAPYFVVYGQEGHEARADKSDQYVYALSNNGFWDNGDQLILGRVLRSKIGNLNAADWHFLAKGNGTDDANWTSDPERAGPVLSKPNHLGMTAAVYLPAQHCYFFIGWYYPAGGGKLPDAHITTKWDFYTAPHPWGPWTVIGSHQFTPQGYYCPAVCPKFTSPDGKTVWIFTAGDWTSKDFYRLTAIPATLD